jgi:hypothetical protein
MNRLFLINEGVGEIVQKFGIDHLYPDSILGNLNWKVKSGPVSKDALAETLNKYNWKTNTVTTIFGADKFKHATKIDVAQTMLHETLHAYFISVLAKTQDSLFIKQRKKILGPNWPVVAYGGEKGQHKFMSKYFRDKIAEALKQFSNDRFSSQFYNYMAWGGMINDKNGNLYQFFKDQVQDPSKRKAIANTIHIEHQGTDINGNYRKQKGTDAGCK